MTPQQLKNAILQQAIQGKLVEQRAEEGTGQELYKGIQEEKEKLIEEGKLKKQKALPDITEEEIPFEIPETWKWVSIGDISNIINGDRGKNYPSKDKLTRKGIPFISAINLDGTTVVEDEKLLCLSDEQYDKLGSGKLEQNDLVLCIRGSIGKHGRYPFEKGAIASSLVILRPYLLNQYLLEYLMIYLDSFLFFSEIKKYDNGTAQPNLSATNLGKFLFPLPPLAEQKRIVEKIEELLPLVERYEKAWSRLEELNKKFPLDMQKAILGQAIQGKLVEQRAEEGTGEELFEAIQNEKHQLIKECKLKKQKALPDITEDEIPFEIPETWKWVRLGELSKSVQYGYNAPAKNKGRIKMVRISDIQDDSVCWDTVPYCDIREEEIEQYLLKNNDILFARTGGTVGKSFLVKNINENAIYAGYLIRTQYGKNIVPQFLKYFMGSELYWSQLRIGTIATAQPNCNGHTLSKMILPLPPLAEQTRIVEKIEELLPLVEKLK